MSSTREPSWRLIFEKQWIHLLFLAASVPALRYLATLDGVAQGELWGLTSTQWLWAAVGLSVAHQGLVWLFWRTELHASLVTRWFGGAGFNLYAVLFSILGIARVVALVLLAIANRDTLDLDPRAAKLIALVLFVPAVYLFYSVRRYFGFRRAFGIDHFDESYRTAPIVRKGIFRFTSNGMYVFGFLILWAIALWYASLAALCCALWNHLYIWVHYYATERPDMRRIYGPPRG